MSDSSDDQCVYCGDWFQCRDHLVPASYMQVYRSYAKGTTVKCCHLCNNLAGDFVAFTVGDKAAHIEKRYRKRFKKVLKLPHWDEWELKQLDYGLRDMVIKNQHMKRLILIKLENLELVQAGFEPVPIRGFNSHLDAIQYKP